MAAAEVNQLCGACHRKVQPEEFTNWSDPWNVRHQPVYFAQSRCFLQSAGKLSCFTCHASHAPVSRSAAAYSTQCKLCHEGARHKTAVDQQDCTSCHMPPVKLDENLRFANHWIGIYARGQVLRPLR
jgi:hypothetical protein